MCGILLVARGIATISKLEADQVNVVPLSERLSASARSASLHRRGPDSWGIEQVALGPTANLQIQGSLLQLRGSTAGVTPIKDGQGNLLVLNGEIFGGLDIAPKCNDSQGLLQALSAGKAPDVFNCLRGPWAAVYWHADTRTLWFGRDVLGRRSLLLHLPSSPDDCLCLVSAAPAALVANLGGKTWSARPSQGSQAADQSGVAKEENSMQHSSLQEVQPGLYSMQFPAAGSVPMTAELNGGVDSTLIAALAHQSLPIDVPIDLASVCFKKGRSADRLAAQDALLELMQFAPTREWRLIQVDSSLEEVDQHRDWLLGLLRPSATVMDLNIAGMHVVHGTTSYEWYKSAARVVLLGHGADEQHAGYGRHRTSFRNHEWTGLQEELAIDMQRLWQRNLGRDDRLVADTSREARHPFLDENYIHTVIVMR
ncbi:hypothetical protein WJX79_003455 [Trebouxia sp. C0005]